MSPHGIAGLQDQSSRNSGNKCQLARPLMLPNFVTFWQEVREVSAVENLYSRQKWTKVKQNRRR